MYDVSIEWVVYVYRYRYSTFVVEKFFASVAPSHVACWLLVVLTRVVGAVP